jgi:hypothetical protein
VTVTAAPQRTTPGVDRLLLAGVAAAVCLALAQAAAQLVDFWAFGLRYAVLNGNSSANAFSWVGGAAMLATIVAFTAAALARVHTRATSTLAVLFTFLLVDNRADIHERLPHGKLLFVPLLFVVLALIWRVSTEAPPVSRRLLRAGLVMLAVSLSVHLAGPTILSWAGWTSGDWQYQVKVAIKEATEIAGWILVCFGSVSLPRKSSALARA